MQFKAKIDKINTLTKGSKIILALDDNATDYVMSRVQNFRKLPLIIEMLVDEPEQKERLGRISEDQRAKIYAIIRDVATHTGNDPETTKHVLKQLFAEQDTSRLSNDFSLALISREDAGDFIEFLIKWAFENGVPLSEAPREAFDDEDRYFIFCLKDRICAVCQEPGEIHHVEAIGMGRDRDKYDDSKHLKICLCRKHHSEAHNTGWETFASKHHLKGVIYSDD